MILKASDDEFYIIANGCAIVPFSTSQDTPYVRILSLKEGKYEEEKWKMLRRLNGDEIASMR